MEEERGVIATILLNGQRLAQIDPLERLGHHSVVIVDKSQHLALQANNASIMEVIEKVYSLLRVIHRHYFPFVRSNSWNINLSHRDRSFFQLFLPP
ncbi:hypothetical protein [Ktedonospora formicarum]|uniref:hypothetical protein n=1 Tax=Ktedonospora formicarum TaxID=2778364 RepID=UPI001C6874DA|nr:hypothetical protein [Ktedonospora formicarum]